MDSNKNYAVPASISANSATDSMQWNSALNLTQDTGANSQVMSVAYDGYARPATSQSPYGATISYGYTGNVKTSTTVNGRTSIQKLDGLGRSTGTISGYYNGSTLVKVSETDIEYTPCACSPLGKVYRTSEPYAPNATKYWTTYTYDALGRTVSVVAPNNSGTTTYVYQGNQVTVTDPAGKWKTMEMDALGNLTTVIEPKPSGAGATYSTTYTYNDFGKLLTVTMPRDGTTQTRTFVHDSKQQLTSSTQPESGTTTYSYNSTGGTVNYKIDAKGQRTDYTYDANVPGRVTQITRKPNGSTVDDCQTTYFYYDSNPIVSGFSYYTTGRLAAAVTGHQNCTPGRIVEMYSYHPAGGVAAKRMRVDNSGGVLNSQTITYNFTDEGKISSYTVPNGYQFVYTYDQMGRPQKLQELWEPTAGLWRDAAKNATYNEAGQLTSLDILEWTDENATNSNYYVTETRQYNFRHQLTQIASSKNTLTYTYSSTQNNGKITKMNDATSGEEVNYAYDELQRLISASTTGTQWGLSWTYDGFGNRLNQAVTKGSAPTSYLNVNPANNRITTSGFAYDANGNMTSMPKGGTTMYMTYDVENRLVTANGEQYAYTTGNKRIWKKDASNVETYTFYGAHGERLDGVYFGGKKIRHNDGMVLTDRLGSVIYQGAPPIYTSGASGTARSYFPYGEERTSTSDNGDKFGTYFRDAGTGLDYADQRYSTASVGRFLQTDPYRTDSAVVVPQSFNRYSYVIGDPITYQDMAGLDYTIPYGASFNPSDPRNVCPGCSSITVDGSSGNYDSGGRGTGVGGDGMQIVGGEQDNHNAASNGGYTGFSACSLVPSGVAISIQASAGLLSSSQVSMDLVLNYNTGTASLFMSAQAGIQFSGGGGFAVTQSLIYGMSNDTATYGNMNYSAQVGNPIGIPPVVVGVQIQHTEGNTIADDLAKNVFAIGVGVGLYNWVAQSLMPRWLRLPIPSAATSATVTQIDLGSYLTSPTFAGILLNQPSIVGATFARMMCNQ